MPFFRATRSSSAYKPDFSGSRPPVIRSVKYCNDPDTYERPTVEHLVRRGSWPRRSIQAPTQDMIDAANRQLCQIWRRKQGLPKEEVSSFAAQTAEKEAAQKAAADEAAARDEAAKKKIQDDEEAAKKAKQLEAEFREKVKTELLEEQKKAEKEAADAEVAAKTKAEAEEKMKEEAGKAAVAKYIAEQEAKKVSGSIATRLTHCYHHCGVHPVSDEAMWDGKVVGKKIAKSAEESKGKEKEKLATINSTNQAEDLGATNGSKSKKGSAGTAATSPSTNIAAPDLHSKERPSSSKKACIEHDDENESLDSLPPITGPPSFWIKVGPKELESWKAYNEAIRKGDYCKNEDRSKPRGILRRRSEDSRYVPQLPRYGDNTFLHRHGHWRHSSGQNRFGSDPDESKYSDQSTARDPQRLLEYEYRYSQGTPRVRAIQVRYDEHGRAFDVDGNEIVLLGEAPCPPLPALPGRPGDNLVPAAVTFGKSPLKARAMLPTRKEHSLRPETPPPEDDLSRFFEA